MKPSILIVENEPSITKLVRTSLKLLGCDAVVESSADAALHCAAKLQPDVALLVELMVGTTGTQLGREIRQISPRTRLILLEFLPDDFSPSRSGSLFETLPVPFPLETLRSVLGRKPTKSSRRKRN
jgi:CheY-like chemotaxis protein